MSAIPQNFRPKGVPPSLTQPQVPLTHYLQVAAVRFPAKPAVVYLGSELSYAALLARVEALAGYLAERLGVRRGDRVLLMSQNCPQYITAHYAILRAGAAVVPVNVMTTGQELHHYLADSGAKVAMVAQELLPRVLPHVGNEGSEGLQAIVVHAYSEALCSAALAQLPNQPFAELQQPLRPLEHAALHGLEHAITLGLPAPPAHPDVHDLCVLPYTSGTTGAPKGCMHSHASVLASGLSSQLWRGQHADSVILAIAPLFHMLGMQGGMNSGILLGATMVLMPRWDAQLAAYLIERYRVTTWGAAPAMLIDFFGHPDAKTRDLTSLSSLAGGGAAMPQAVSEWLQSAFGIQFVEAYGLTETASFLLANPPQRTKQQCLGIPTSGVDARIVDPESLQELAQGEVGEIVVHAPQVMQAYWRNETANAQAFFERDGKRFFRTGDLANIDEEGYFFMRDRLKRMINAGGYKVWPAEVENQLYTHPAVHEACVIATLDERRGEAVKALVVLKPDWQDRLNEQELIDWSRTQMAVYKAPRLVRFVAQLPKSNTGKILWRQLQEEERNEQST